MSSYKWCAVPQCTNTTIKTPTKLFISVPMDLNIRKKWFQLARRNADDISPKTRPYFCEEHFDIEKDMNNYYQYKMGFCKKILLNDGVLPSKFHCQPDRRKRTCDTETFRPGFAKRHRSALIEQCVTDHLQPSQPSQPVDVPLIENVENITAEPRLIMCDKDTSTEPIITAEKSILCKMPFRSKAVQTKIFTRDTPVSPYKFSTKTSCTSPFKIDRCPCQAKPSKSGIIHIKKRIGFDEERSDSDVSMAMDAPRQETSSSYAVTSSSKISVSSSSVTDTNEDILKMQSLQNNLKLIVRKPKMYIGIPKECYFLINLIHKHTIIPHEHILLCLKKIKLYSTFSELEDNFGLSLSYGSKLFLKNIPLIASVMRPFIVKLDKHSITKTLPVSFRHNYYKVSCIVDCLEIDIQKPTKAQLIVCDFANWHFDY